MRVLVIDDSALTRKMIIRTIEQAFEAATFDEAGDGDEALALLNEHDYDIFTIDYNMPGANGEIVAIAAKTNSPNARICMLTSQEEPEVQHRVERIGVRFLRKPDFQDELLDFVKAS